MLAGENIGEFTYLGYLKEKTLVNNLQVKYRCGKFCKFEGEIKTLAISHHFAKFPSVFSCQCFLLYMNVLPNWFNYFYHTAVYYS